MAEGKKDEDREPGASRHGNFINYYKFHPADERVRQLPQGVWQLRNSDRKYSALDVGCNAGNLTIELHKFLQEQLPSETDVQILGIDLDPILIERARESCSNPAINFECLDFFSEDRKNVLSDYLRRLKSTEFDVVFCFSITMWIHLNYGDEGLVKFLEDICQVTKVLVIEPQPWKCYRNASRRMRRSGEEDFPLINKLKLTGEMEKHIERIVCEEKRRFRQIITTQDNNWGRKILIFERI
ncbi:probable RNA methyltransferase CG11342 [Diachasmimorpha longicaudata]|uniref:probable RNA methyltransferase CG11342 n=1 Tax=Diachasmimorpha longicaudata TaxID=58733 RepID=UPI0030B8AAE8